jgi:cysteine desulfurase/selenocysteine lyase
MSLKQDFPIFTNNPGMIYLDSAASLQKPSMVVDGIKEYLEHSYANIHRGQYKLSEISELLYWQARKKVAELISATDEEIVFTASATDSINKLVQSLILT